MKKAIIILTGIILSGLAFEGCKKGEGDPGISFKSRKSRMTGEWKMSAGTITHTTVSGSSNISTTTTYNGSTASSVLTVNGTPNPANTNGYTVSWTIEKDGTFESIAVTTSGSTTSTTTTKGTWNFLNGVGEFKNKEAVEFFSSSVTTTSGSSTTTSTYTGSDMPSVTYMIHTLKNKELIMKHDYTDVSSSTSITHTEEWTYGQ